MKNEKLILKYLDIKYGDCKVLENEDSIFIRDFGHYVKTSNIIGFTSYVHHGLVDWFGEGRYYPELKKWFCKKCEITNDVMTMME